MWLTSLLTSPAQHACGLPGPHAPPAPATGALHFALVGEKATHVTTAELARKLRAESGLPVLVAGCDSCCTAHVTPFGEYLINTRPCADSYKQADGTKARALGIGDLPVACTDTTGKPCTFLIRNVRFVPGFAYTLLSVDQLWDEQSVESQFAATRCLHFTAGPIKGTRVPFTRATRLPALVMVPLSRLRGGEKNFPARSSPRVMESQARSSAPSPRTSASTAVTTRKVLGPLSSSAAQARAALKVARTAKHPKYTA